MTQVQLCGSFIEVDDRHPHAVGLSHLGIRPDSVRRADEVVRLLGNPGQAMSPLAEPNTSCLYILFVTELWGGEGMPVFSHGDMSMYAPGLGPASM